MNSDATGGAGESFEILIGELTSVAYSLTQQQGMRDRWLELELALWYALGEAARRASVATHRNDDFLAELTDAAYRTAVGFGIPGSFLEFELRMHEAFRALIEAKSTARPDAYVFSAS